LLALFARSEHERVRRVLDAPPLLAQPCRRAARLAVSHQPATAEFVPIRRQSQSGVMWLVTLRPARTAMDVSDSDPSYVALTAGVVHDLRTPLQSVLGWASLLRRTREPERIESALTIIERNAKVQMDLLEDLLELLRPSPSSLQLRRQRIDLASLVKAELRAVEPLADERQVLVSLTVTTPSVEIDGNETDLRRIVANLVANALKFTPGGGSIECRVWQSGAWAGVAVRDTGHGIDPAFVPHIFEAYRQEPGAEGWGLGLSVVRHLVRRHGGTVTVRSAGRGRGTTFSVLFPTSSPKVHDARLALVPDRQLGNSRAGAM
jgi:signal transduction histidine kinase